jgi:hypothetical protein
MGAQVGLRKKSRSANVRGAGKTHHARASGQGRPDISPTDAFAIIRSGIDESRPANSFDWDRIRHLLGGHSQEPPADAITVVLYTSKFNVAENTARRALAALVDRGVLETGIFFDRVTNRFTRYWWSREKGKR